MLSLKETSRSSKRWSSHKWRESRFPSTKRKLLFVLSVFSNVFQPNLSFKVNDKANWPRFNTKLEDGPKYNNNCAICEIFTICAPFPNTNAKLETHYCKKLNYADCSKLPTSYWSITGGIEINISTKPASDKKVAQDIQEKYRWNDKKLCIEFRIHFYVLCQKKRIKTGNQTSFVFTFSISISKPYYSFIILLIW